MLLGCGVDQDVELAERLEGLTDRVAIALAVADITAHQEAAPSFALDQSSRPVRVIVLFEVCDVRTFFGEKNGHGFSDAGIGAADQGDLVFELAGGLLATRFRFGFGCMAASRPGCLA